MGYHPVLDLNDPVLVVKLFHFILLVWSSRYHSKFTKILLYIYIYNHTHKTNVHFIYKLTTNDNFSELVRTERTTYPEKTRTKDQNFNGKN